MLVLAAAMVLEIRRPSVRHEPRVLAGAPAAMADPAHDAAAPSQRRLVARDGKEYANVPHGLSAQRLFSGAGAFSAGLISTGVGEATMPLLVRRSRFPVAVAAATSTVVVAGTVVGAAVTHSAQLIATDGFTAVPWNLIVWAVPGALAGATIGTRLQGRISERTTKVFFAALFCAIGATFLLAFTVLGFG
jgi:hypothetical protein